MAAQKHVSNGDVPDPVFAAVMAAQKVQGQEVVEKLEFAAVVAA